ncbi:hypothetical protein ZOSMA_10G01000 [Zostera marina]|uniref:Uncharacterized protein n=1 Tax=Zostera marina TaxID=29655 RepID=A0A0K9Q5M3_ZOSMR|nr:hypothetical protein ZOSMA_10G01000 [Zostera marina]
MPSKNRKPKSSGNDSEGKKKKNRDTISFDSTSVGSNVGKDKCETSNAEGILVKDKRERTEDNLYIINDLIRHRSGIPTYVDAVRKGKIKFTRSIVRKMKDTCFRAFVGMVDFPIKSRLLDDLDRYTNIYRCRFRWLAYLVIDVRVFLGASVILINLSKTWLP